MLLPLGFRGALFWTAFFPPLGPGSLPCFPVFYVFSPKVASPGGAHSFPCLPSSIGCRPNFCPAPNCLRCVLSFFSSSLFPLMAVFFPFLYTTSASLMDCGQPKTIPPSSDFFFFARIFGFLFFLFFPRFSFGLRAFDVGVWSEPPLSPVPFPTPLHWPRCLSLFCDAARRHL